MARMVKIEKLKPHPQNEIIYGLEDVSDLVAQIEAYGGIANPIKAKDDGTIISGHRRWKAAKELHMPEVPVDYVKYDSEAEEIAALVMFNYHRVKTNEQRAREGIQLEEALRADGFRRKLTNLKQFWPDVDESSLSEDAKNGSDSEDVSGQNKQKGRTRDIVAEAVKIGSGRQFDRMKAVIQKADELKAAGKSDDAVYLLEQLNKSPLAAEKLSNLGEEQRTAVREKRAKISDFAAPKDNSSNENLVAIKKVISAVDTATEKISAQAFSTENLDSDLINDFKNKIAKLKDALAEIEQQLSV